MVVNTDLRPCSMSVLITFTVRVTKQHPVRATFFKCKSHLKEADDYKGVFINENLTRYRADLLRCARKLVKNKSLLSVWSFDGRICVKLPDSSKRHIQSKEDLGTIQ